MTTMTEAITSVVDDVAMTHVAACVCRACLRRDLAWVFAWMTLVEIYDRGDGAYRAYLHNHLGGHTARITAAWYRPRGIGIP